MESISADTIFIALRQQKRNKQACILRTEAKLEKLRTELTSIDAEIAKIKDQVSEPVLDYSGRGRPRKPMEPASLKPAKRPRGRPKGSKDRKVRKGRKAKPPPTIIVSEETELLEHKPDLD